MTEYWTERAELVNDEGVNAHCLAEDEYGDLLVPMAGQPGMWKTRLNLWKPWHWPPYLLSRFLRRIVMVER